MLILRLSLLIRFRVFKLVQIQSEQPIKCLKKNAGSYLHFSIVVLYYIDLQKIWGHGPSKRTFLY